MKSGIEEETVPNSLLESFIRFGSVGLLATTIQYALLIALVQSAGVGAVPASGVSFAISALANYALNYHFTFRSAKAHVSALPRFTLVAMMGLAINTMLMAVMVESMEWHYLFSQAISTGIVLFWNFILNHRWSFREAPSN